MELPAAKRHRRYSANRNTIQGLLGSLEQEQVRVEQRTQQGGSSAGPLYHHTWSGPQSEWAGPIPGFVGHTAPAPVIPGTGDTAPAAPLDILAVAAIGESVAAAIGESVASAGSASLSEAQSQLEPSLRWMGGASPMSEAVDETASISTNETSQPAVVEPWLDPSASVGLLTGPPSGAAAIGARGKLHRPCANCRSAKVLCDRHLPCTRCVRLNIGDSCEAPPTVQRGRPSHHARLLQLRNLASNAAGACVDCVSAAPATGAQTTGAHTACCETAPPTAPPTCCETAPPTAPPSTTPMAPPVIMRAPDERNPLSHAAEAPPPVTLYSPAQSPLPLTEGAPVPVPEEEATNIEGNVDALRRQLLAIGVTPCV